MRGRTLSRWSARLGRGETIPHEEKVFSNFEGHTRWSSKGKAGTPVELGVPVALIEDQYGLILHHEVLCEGADLEAAVPMVKQAQVLYPELRACGFDRGFHRTANREGLDALLAVQCVAGQGLSFEGEPRARRRRSQLWPRGERIRRLSLRSMDWSIEHSTAIRSHGAEGFARTVALSVLAANAAPQQVGSAEAGAQTTTTRGLTNRDLRNQTGFRAVERRHGTTVLGNRTSGLTSRHFLTAARKGDSVAAGIAPTSRPECHELAPISARKRGVFWLTLASAWRKTRKLLILQGVSLAFKWRRSSRCRILDGGCPQDRPISGLSSRH